MRARWLGHRVAALRLSRESRQAWLLFSEGQDRAGAIGLLLHPGAGFVLSGGAVPPVSREADRRIDFRRLFLSDVWSPVDERLLVLELAGGRRTARADLPPVYRLFVELHTNQWNAVLTRGADDRIEAVLWPRSAGGRDLAPGAAYKRPEGARSWADSQPDADEWAELLESVPPARRRETLLRSAAWTSSLNVDWILGEAASVGGRDALSGAHERYLRLRTGSRDEAWLLPGGATLQPYPLALRPQARRCASLLEAMRLAAEQTSAWPSRSAGDATGDDDGPAASQEAEHLERVFRRRIRDLENRTAALERQLEGETPDHLRDLGHLLLARKSDVPKGSERAKLQGFDGSEVEVALDPSLDVIQNAERYYDRARRRERASRAIPGHVRRTTARIARLQTALAELRTTGPAPHLWDLVGGRPDGTGSRDRAGRSREGEPLPYRRFRSSGGLEIRVGRSSRANDTLTFRHSAPEDIWLHARQAAGAHVILRWERRDQNPPLADLTEAAVLAALHSEARHSGLVAVDWTRRKHVRKPRKAPPGAVIPERVATLFVEPDPAVSRRLSSDN